MNQMYWALFPSGEIEEISLTLRQCEVGAISGYADYDFANEASKFLLWKRQNSHVFNNLTSSQTYAWNVTYTKIKDLDERLIQVLK